ncbi:MAG: CoA transferase, partial [Pseudomonadota bacterium]
FKGFGNRRRNRDELAEALDPILSAQTTSHWAAKLAGQVPVAPVLTVAQALDNPYVAERGGVQTFDHPSQDGFRVLSSPIWLDGQRPLARPGPALGADTDALLTEVGYSRAEIETMRADGVV